MKNKILIVGLLIVSLVSINCSKDDDGGPAPIDSSNFYGRWSLDYYVNSGQLVEEILCSEQVTYLFVSNGTYTKTTFAGEGSTNCSTAVIINGTWENLGNDQLQLTANGSSTNETLEITFQDNETKFTITYTSAYIEVYSKQ